VHARSRLPAWVGWRALQGLLRERRPRFVTTVHGLNSPSRYSAIMARGERVICVSDTVRGHVLQHYPHTDPALLRVIPRGIDPAAFPRAPVPDIEARGRAAERFPELRGSGPLLLLPGRGPRLRDTPTRWHCGRRCAHRAPMRACGCPEPASRGVPATWMSWKGWPAAWALPRRWP